MRIAKFIAHSGLCSRRQAEKIISQGRVILNGQTIIDPAININHNDKVYFEGQRLTIQQDKPRIWEFHKPQACVVTESDEKNRKTVFDIIDNLNIKNLPRLIAIGRLDYNSEGLLLFTNNGELARSLELPKNNFQRCYRVRIFGNPKQDDLNKLQNGITVEGISYAPMQAEIIRKNGANCWLNLILNEGKNREIRIILEALGYPVNRLIRTNFGDFTLENLPTGEIREVQTEIIKTQLNHVFNFN